MGHVKTFYQLFESSVQLRPSHYWYFVVFFPDKRIGNTRVARFLVSGDSTKTITTEFLENLLPRYLGFDSLYTLSPDVAPPVINGFMQFGDWVHENIDEISDRAGVEKIYINGREIANGLDFPEFLDAFDGEETNDNYTEMYGEPNHIAWLIMNHFRTNREGELKGKYELNEIFEFFNEPVGNSIGKNNHLLKIGEKYSEVLDQIFDSKDADWIYDYFKNNPLELYIVEFPKIKEKILLKTGIKDYSDIGRKLKKGLM